MRILEIYKKNKKIKIIQENRNLVITGPLGTTTITIKNTYNSFSHNLFLEYKTFNFFFKKIKEAFVSVSTGWFKELNLNGIGYKSFKIKNKIALDLGYSNLILFTPNNQIKIKNLKNKIVLFSINKEYLNNVAICLKNYSIPDSYKGKGILFKNEILKLKKKAKS